MEYKESLLAGNFAAIDVETATRELSSICAVGIAIYQNGEIVERRYSYVRPPENRYEHRNIGIHGITPDVTEDSLIFPEVVQGGFFNDLHGMVVFAHNVSTEMNAFQQCSELYGMASPIPKWGCTLRAARKYLQSESYRLPVLLEKYGHRYESHRADNDAEACGILAKILLPELLADTVNYADDDITAFLRKQVWKASEYNAKDFDSALLRQNTAADPGNYWYGKRVVFTGDLDEMDRPTAANILHGLGADINTAISGKTDIVIIGQKAGPNKLKKISELKEKGVNIVEMYEREFLRMLST